MADISQITLPNGSVYNLKDSNARQNISNLVTGVKGNAETAYRKGNVNLTIDNLISAYARGTTDISIRPLIDRTRANRLIFLPADQIIVEKTTDGGNTWVDAELSNSIKEGIFVNGGNGNIPLLNGVKSTNCGLRFTITGMKYNVPQNTPETEKYNYWNSNYIKSCERYFNVREWWFWVSSNNDTIRCQIEAATGVNSTAWIPIFNKNFTMTGWSGSDWIRAGGGNVFGGGITQTTNFWNWRLTFWSAYADGETTFRSNTMQQITIIRCYGDSVWVTTNNNMALQDHLYSYDNDKNATFPAAITATAFNGNATSATVLKNSHTIQTNLESTSSASFNGSADITPGVTGTLGVAHGGTGKTTGKDAANYFMNSLDTGSSTPADADYYISQYVSGGTSTTTYHRRPMSALWAYIKSKLDANGGYANKNQFGNVKVGSTTIAADTIQDTLELVAGSNVTLTPDTTNDKITITSTYTDTKNTAGSSNSSSKLFIVGATSQAINSVTYSQDTAYIGTDGCLYSNNQKVFTVAGGTINGTVSVDNAFSANSAEIGNLVVTGDATFTNGLRGNLIGTVNGSTPIKGGTNAASSVSITPTTATIYSMTSAGSVTAGTATTPAKVDTSKFSGGSLTMAIDSTDTKKLNITFTPGSLASGFYTAGTKGTPTAVTLPSRGSATTVWTGYSAATAAAQTFTGTPC